MEFWGVEVKAGEPLTVSPDDNAILHLSQAALGESKKGNEPVMLFVRVGDKRLVLGTLSNDKFPQQSFDVVFEQEFELSHNWKHGSVFFCGYQSAMPDDDEDDMYGSSEDEEDFPLMDTDNGKLDVKVENAKPVAASAKPKALIAEPTKASKSEDKPNEDEDEDDDSEGDSEDDSDDSSGEESEEGMDDEDESGESGSEDEETPKKVEHGKKRSGDSAIKTPVPSKKAKAVTPQKTDGKKNVHTATPHPAKNAGKTAANGTNQTPKSGGQFSCKSCERSFNSDNALQSHTKAKHGK